METVLPRGKPAQLAGDMHAARRFFHLQLAARVRARLRLEYHTGVLSKSELGKERGYRCAQKKRPTPLAIACTYGTHHVSRSGAVYPICGQECTGAGNFYILPAAIC